uniref:Galactose mutarotase n=1 Tax=Lygus hesperus TaxID=30085 RepID=A0A0A9ZH17_LYGHE
MALQPSSLANMSNEELEYPGDMPEVDEFLIEEGEGEQGLDIMKLLMEPPLPKPIALGKIVEDGFGFYKKIYHEELGDHPKYIADDIVRRYTLINDSKVIVQVINYGATVTAIAYPDKEGKIADVLLGFENMEGYLSDENPRFGGALGRFSGIISEATGKIGSNEFFLTENNDFDHVYGGIFGFDKVLWHSYVDKDKVVMTYTSADKEEGYPGVLQAQITFKLTSTNQLIVQTSATCSKPSPISIAHNLYFNLAGHGMGPEALKQHVLLVNADRWMLTDPETGKFTGELQNVGATYFDVRVPRPVSKILNRVPGGGYNHNFALTKGLPKKAITFAARLVHPESGRFMEIHTDYPSLHVTTSNHLPNPDRLFGLFGEDKEDKSIDRLEFLCKEKGEEGDWMWPKRMMSTMEYPRPLSIPEEEHVFKRFSEMSLTEQSTEESGKDEEEGMKNTQSMMANTGTLGEDAKRIQEAEVDGEDEEEGEEREDAPRPILGKGSNEYRYQGAISFTAEEFPDPFLYKRHPRPIVTPGQPYTRTTIYKFGCVPPKPINPAMMAPPFV